MKKRIRKLELNLKREIKRMERLCILIEQQNKDMYYDSKSSEYGVNKKIH